MASPSSLTSHSPLTSAKSQSAVQKASGLRRWWSRILGREVTDDRLRHFAAFEPIREEYANNLIRTAKYTPLTFVPHNLWEQFHRLSNVYFLLIAVLEFTPVSSIDPVDWIPLLFVLGANMVKESNEDRRRAKQDKEINHQEVLHLDPEQGSIQPLRWQDIRVGHVLVLHEDSPVPADVIVVATADKAGGLVYIDTAQLDGETNLKSKESVEFCHKALTATLPDGGQQRLTDVPPDHVQFLRGLAVECEPPNARLDQFIGRVTGGDGASGAISNKQVVYRGCTVRNTKWAYALVVYTGMETKLMKNSVAKKLKRTTLDNSSDQYIIGLFGLQFGLCFLAAICSAVWITNHDGPRPWFIDTQQGIGEAIGMNIWTFMILMCSIIPISLNVTAEIVKVYHARFINWDKRMVHVDPVTHEVMHSKARTSNLGEDLGRIEYIFSDKTGTLTQNMMEFMKCSIEGQAYGTGTTEIGRAAALREGRVLPEEPRPLDLRLERGDNFYDPRLSFGRWRGGPSAAAVERFFRLLAVCHTVMAKPREGAEEDEAVWTPDNVGYQASSPDEEALVMGAKGQGFWFKRRNHRECYVELPDGAVACYTLLAVNEFNSTRKRMSVVVQTPDGRTLLMVKGADNVVFERLRLGDPHVGATTEHLMGFANEGLRTLVLAERELSEREFMDWKIKYDAAFQSTVDRDQRLDDVAEEIERHLELVGATAIEDKLQDGVPAAIQTLRAAGIQLWILTGDKVETAINIAMACNLIHPAMHLAKVTLHDLHPGQEGDAMLEAERQAEVEQQLCDAIAYEKGVSLERALVIDGASLKHALAQEQSAGEQDGLMLQFTNTCTAVVCSRVSPKQKADVVSLVRRKHNRITLAIGDGANDVSMILKAHIGVGIAGREGQQAAMSSDYSIAQFRFLQNLILIHGRWSYQRVSLLICYFFYSNIGFAMVTFWFGYKSGFSGPYFYDNFYQTMWNTIFTVFPIVFVTINNKDVQFQGTLLGVPEMYKDVQQGQPCALPVFGAWVLDSVLCGVVAFFVTAYCMEVGQRSDGLDSGLWLTAFTSYAGIAAAVNVRLWMHVKSWSRRVMVSCVGTVIAFYIFGLIYQLLPPNSLFFVNGNVWWLVNDFWVISKAWATIALVTAICLLLPSIVWVVHYTWLEPTLSLAVIREEAAFIQQAQRAGRVPVESEWAKHLPRQRPRPPTPPATVAPPAQATGAGSDGFDKVPDTALDLLGSAPSPTPTNTAEPQEGMHTIFYGDSAVVGVDVEDPYLGYSFSGQRGQDPEVVNPTVTNAQPRENVPPRGLYLDTQPDKDPLVNPAVP